MMLSSLTLAMIKPHALLGKNGGPIITEMEEAGFAILMSKITKLRKEGAQEFYQRHRGKDFFDNLVSVMSSGPVWVFVLAKENAVEEWNNVIGNVDPAKAEPGTIRARFGDHNNIINNAVHGSATDHDARREIVFFFGEEIARAIRLEELEKEVSTSSI